ncbi:transcription initiation factor IIB family protein [Halobacterium sp. R2-5]|uniref:transcription initiation factor IIB family protein n=1 Tax=Halobacterium sp. R2-5 TaxID=2715751 RepID=UPI001421B89F|nr:transcription initiation factor IIB family protein [Halobacterium sp. R2-5]NIC00252.1 transcription initiation factor IIB family protein [Halobacterium sp. R2-5]
MSQRDFRAGGIRYVASEIERMGDSLDLSESVIKQGLRIYHQILEQDIEFARLDDLSALCVYATVRLHQEECGATFREVAAEARIKDSRLQTVSSRILSEAGVPLPPPRPETTLKTTAEELGVSDEIDILLDIVDSLTGRLENLAPTTIAASTIFAGQYLSECSYDVTQSEVSNVVGPTEVTIRNEYTKILKQVYQETEYTIEKHRFEDTEHGISVLKTECSLPPGVVTETEAVLEAHTELVAGNGSTEAGVCAAVLEANQRVDDGRPDLSVDDLTDVVHVTNRTINEYRRTLR